MPHGNNFEKEVSTVHTVIGVCSTFTQAEEVVQDLVNNGFLNEHMSIIARRSGDWGRG